MGSRHRVMTMGTVIHLDSYHYEGSQRIDHHLGTLSGEAPRRRFLFRYRDKDSFETELTLDENADGDFDAIYTYPPNRQARDTGLGAMDSQSADDWTIDVTGIWQGHPGHITYCAKRKSR